MARTNVVLITAALLGAFGSGLLLGRSIDRGQSELQDSAGNSLVAPEARRPSAAADHPFQEVRAASAPRPEAETVEGFGYQRLVLESDGDVPRACLQFSEPLDASGEVNYVDYVRVSPDLKPAISITNVSMCLTGLQFNTEYTVRLREGLPSGAGEELARSEEVVVAFGDKPAYVGFAGDGVVLPRMEADGLGLETVNVDKLNVKIYRVSNRALARKRIIAGGAAGEDDYYYVYGEEDGEDVGVKVFDDDIAVDAIRNDLVTTVFPLGAALPELAAGAYFIRVKDASPGADERRTAQAWRWVVFTDLALSAYSSSEGVDVVVRSIATARPRAGWNCSSLRKTTTSSPGPSPPPMDWRASTRRRSAAIIRKRPK